MSGTAGAGGSDKLSSAAISIDWRERIIVFVGAGELVEAMLSGIIGSGMLRPHQIRVTNRGNRERLRRLSEQFGVDVNQDKAAILKGADLVVLAVKPSDAATVLTEITGHVDESSVLVSVMAGISLDYLFEQVGGHHRLVRAMPNTASRIGQAATALCAHPTCDQEAFSLAVDLFQRIGRAVNVSEELFDAVTAVSGSGPAYVYLLLEAMLQAAGDLGLPPEIARQLAVQTLIGAGAMLNTTDLPPDVLRHQVTSPAGTTAAALKVLEESGFSDAVSRAVKRAAQRAAELSGR